MSCRYKNKNKNKNEYNNNENVNNSQTTVDELYWNVESHIVQQEQENNQQERDSGGVVSWVFGLLGVGILVPWNAFISAKPYFQARLCDADSNSSNNNNNLEAWFSFYYNVGSVLSLLLLLWLQQQQQEAVDATESIEEEEEEDIRQQQQEYQKLLPSLSPNSQRQQQRRQQSFPERLRRLRSSGSFGLQQPQDNNNNIKRSFLSSSLSFHHAHIAPCTSFHRQRILRRVSSSLPPITPKQKQQTTTTDEAESTTAALSNDRCRAGVTRQNTALSSGCETTTVATTVSYSNTTNTLAADEEDDSDSADDFSWWMVQSSLTIFLFVFVLTTLGVLFPQQVSNDNGSSFPSYSHWMLMGGTFTGLFVCGACTSLASAGVLGTAGLAKEVTIGIVPYVQGQAVGGVLVALANLVAAAAASATSASSSFDSQICATSIFAHHHDEDDDNHYHTHLPMMLKEMDAFDQVAAKIPLAVDAAAVASSTTSAASSRCIPYTEVDWPSFVYFLSGCVVLVACMLGYGYVDDFITNNNNNNKRNQQQEQQQPNTTSSKHKLMDLNQQQQQSMLLRQRSTTSTITETSPILLIKNSVCGDGGTVIVHDDGYGTGGNDGGYETFVKENNEDDDDDEEKKQSSTSSSPSTKPTSSSPYKNPSFRVLDSFVFDDDDENDENNCCDNENDNATTTAATTFSTMDIFRLVRDPTLAMFFTFLVTLSLFPVVTSDLSSVSAGCSHYNHNYYLNADGSGDVDFNDAAATVNDSFFSALFHRIIRHFQTDLFTPMTFVVFNVGDLIGRSIVEEGGATTTTGSNTELDTKNKNIHNWLSRNLVTLSIARILLIPLFLLCYSSNQQREDDSSSSSSFVIYSDTYSWLLQVLLAVSNGLLTSLCFSQAPSLVPNTPQAQQISSGILNLAMSAGLLLGSFLSFPVVWLFHHHYQHPSFSFS